MRGLDKNKKRAMLRLIVRYERELKEETAMPAHLLSAAREWLKDDQRKHANTKVDPMGIWFDDEDKQRHLVLWEKVFIKSHEDLTGGEETKYNNSMKVRGSRD